MTFTCNIELHIKAFDNKFFYSIPVLLRSLSLSENNYGVVNLPTVKKRFTVLRSPHIDKKSRDQFELRVYKKVYTLHKQFTIAQAQNFIAMSKRKLPAGLGINYVCTVKKI